MAEVDFLEVQHFFEVNNKIKMELYDNVPPMSNEPINKKVIKDYTDKFDDSLRYIFTELKCVSKNVFGKDSLWYKKVCEMDKSIKKEFYHCGYDLDKLRNFYRKMISNMDYTFVDEVRKTCVGYSATIEFAPVNKAKTINELLHVMHSYIINNRNIINKVPIVDQKTNSFNYPIVLRGESGEVFNNLFNKFPTDLEVGWTDMMAIDIKTMILLIRDRAHATTISIGLKDDKAVVKYFIPKICNLNMVNALPGLSNKVDENSVWAVGNIEVDVNELPDKLFDLISRIPNDQDVIKSEGPTR